MIVDVDLLQEAMDFITHVNSAKLQDITWVGSTVSKAVKIQKEDIDNWRFVGLSNVYFAREYNLIS